MRDAREIARELVQKRIKLQVDIALKERSTLYVSTSVDIVEQAIREARAEALALIDAPEVRDFTEGVRREVAHQRKRWGSEHDAGKTPADWFWRIGYLAGKALHAHAAGDTEKALHHTVTTAAALANWHAGIIGKTDMRPGIETPDLAEEAHRG